MNINKTNNLGWTKLQIASLKGDIIQVKRLIALGADVNIADQFGYTPLHEACYTGQIVELLLAAGAYPYPVHEFNTPPDPFEISCIKGHILLAFLLDFKRASQVWPVCYQAAYQGDLKTLKSISKSYFNVKNDYGWCILHLAVLTGQKKMIDYLLENGANLYATSSKGYTSLHLASYYNEFDIVQQLINWGADVNCIDNEGATPLHSAAAQDADKVGEILIKAGSDIHHQNNKGKTPFHIACETATDGTSKMLKLLLKKGAHINARDNKGNNALFTTQYLGRKNSLKIACLLLDKGADPYQTNNKDESFYQILLAKPSKSTKKLLTKLKPESHS